jgi:type I restriction-modification system DNA methylase subunit
MSNQGSDALALVGIPEIAEIADVSRPAVSNWRKRHSDFPTPVVQSPSGAMFDLQEIEEWLVVNGKITGAIPNTFKLWAIAEQALGRLTPNQLMQFLVSALVYFEFQSQRPEEVDQDAAWIALQDVDGPDFLPRLAQAYQALEAQHPQLDGLLSAGIDRLDPGQSAWARQVMAYLWSSATPEHSFGHLFDDVLERLVARDRFADAHSMPEMVRSLIGLLTIGGGSTIVDLALGEGGLLALVAGFNAPADGSTAPTSLTGVEVSSETARMARTRFLLGELEVDVRTADSLTLAPETIPYGDIVLADPPWGLTRWGDASTYLSDRWPFGAPSPSSADLAWVQRVIMQLSPRGRGYVLSPPSTLMAEREHKTRAEMVAAGAIECIIQLPPRLRADVALAPALWIVRPAQPDPGPVLLIDATDQVEVRQTRSYLTATGATSIYETVKHWRTHHEIPEDARGMAFAVSVQDVLDNGAVLTPERYRPAATIDTGALRARQRQLLAALPDDISERLTPMDAVAPSTFARVPLGELVEIHRPRSFKAVDPAEATEEMTARVIDGRELRGDAFRVVDPSTLTKPVIAATGDVVVTTIGLIESTVVDDEWAGAIVGQNSVLLRITDPSRVLPEWIRLWTKSASYRDQVERHQVGAVIPRLSKQALLAMTIPLPPLQIQQQAAAAAQTLAKEIAMHQEVLHQLQALDEIEADLMMMGGGTE